MTIIIMKMNNLNHKRCPSPRMKIRSTFDSKSFGPQLFQFEGSLLIVSKNILINFKRPTNSILIFCVD